MRPFRILLINAVNTLVETETRQPNLGLGYLAATLRQQLHGSEIEFKIAERDVRAAIRDFKPDLAGISSVSQNYNIALRYSEATAAANIPTIMGGIHLSALPHTLAPTAMAAVLGEGEQTFVEIVQAALGGLDLLADKLPSIAGLVYRRDDHILTTKPRPLLSDLDDLPTPSRDLFNIKTHTYMFTSRGCPYNCTFCASTRFWNKIRFFSAEYVVEEITLLKKDYNVDLISFYDDLFPASMQRLERITELLSARGLLGKIKFTTNCRANLVSPKLAAVLKKLGVVSVGLGLESGDEETLTYLKGGSVSVAQNANAINLLKKEGLAANASFVIGSPQETKEQMLRTYHFIRTSNLDLFDIYLLTPFPGTPVWEVALEKGVVSEKMKDWSLLNINTHLDPNNALILSEVLSRKEILSIYKRFRRLRLRWNLARVWKHPLRRSLPRIVLVNIQYLLSKIRQSIKLMVHSDKRL